VRFGSLRRVKPVCSGFGYARGGQRVARHYVDRFLAEHASDVRGDVMEVGDSAYTRRVGGDRVTKSHVLHATADNPEATLVGDLASGAGIPDNAFDCMILTQVMMCIYDVQTAVQVMHRALRPGGVVLVTNPGISQVSRYDMDRWGDFWRFTSRSLRNLFADVFGDDTVDLVTYGNVLAATAVLQGITADELTQGELDYHDPDYEVIIGVRARKGA
jgi:SAM-dependent methyltransferase